MSSITAEQLNNQLDPSMWPRFTLFETLVDGYLLSLKVPDDLCFFAGHFPEQAVLPGVVQVHWAGELAKRLFDVSGFSELKGIKFASMILPSQDVQLSLAYKPEIQRLKFDYSYQDEKFSSGSIVFNAVAPS